MPVKTIIISGRMFKRGKAECLCCEHKFKYLLPLDMIAFWEQLCSSCTLAMPEEEVKPGKIVMEIMEW